MSPLRLYLSCVYISFLAALLQAVVRQPSFIVFLLDDLDETQGSSGEAAMPAIKRLLADRGVTFANHFVTTPICCPSRVNLLHGQLSHNTNFTDVLGPHGGYAKFRDLGLDREWLPVWLQRAGYNTLYTGKFIVDYTILNRDPAPAGWTAFDALVHPFTFEYYNPAFSLNGGEPRVYPAQYVTDVLAAKAVALLRSAAADPSGRPFYLQVAPPAPHHSMHYDYNASGVLAARHWYPPVPAARHWEELSSETLPRPPSFNDPDVRGKPAWVRALERLTPGNITFLEEVFRLRLRSLRAVDELVAAVVSELESLGLASSTYLLFTSDNGYHEGPHRQGSGKTTAYEEDLRVPMIVAGPGLRPGSRMDATTLHIDIAPTVLALAGVALPPSLDGTPLPLAAVSDGDLPAGYSYGSPDLGPLRNQMLAEFWGVWDDESIHSHPPYTNLTWKAVRVLRNDLSEAYKYVMHCSGELELYDLVQDPYERVNLLAAVPGPDGDRRGWISWLRSLLGSPPEIGTTTKNVATAASTTAAATNWSAVPLEALVAPSTGSGGQAATDDPDAAADITHGNNVKGPLSSTANTTPATAAAPSAFTGALGPFASALDAWARTPWAKTRGSSSPVGGPGGHVGSRIRSADGPAASTATAAPSRRATFDGWLARIHKRLDALLAVLAVCSGQACARPFQVLHPDGSVSDLWTAMDEQYDVVYDAIQPFSFGRCLRYQDLDNERSQFRGAVVPGSGQQGSPCAAVASEAAQGVEAARCEVAEPSQWSGDQGREGGQRSSWLPGMQETSPTAGEGPTFRLLESDIESSAVPLPARYKLIKDIYGNTAVEDAMRLA